MNYGYITVASAIPQVRVADVDYNVEQIERFVVDADKRGVEILVFPELSVTGYSCQDLFAQQALLDRVEKKIVDMLEATERCDVISVVGAPICIGGGVYNCAVVCQHGKVLGIVPKRFLPNYGEFYEKRWFASSDDLTESVVIGYAGSWVSVSGEETLFKTARGVKFGIELCEDVWSPLPPSTDLVLSGADIILNLSASDDLIGKNAYLKSLLAQQSARLICGYVYSSCGFGESTQDVVYGGNAFVYENGALVAESERFSLEEQLVVSQIDVDKLRTERRRNTSFVHAQCGHKARVFDADETDERRFELLRHVDSHPFIPESDDMYASCDEIFSIQVCGLAKRLVHTHCKCVVIGISGGLDSTLALLVCVKTFDKLGYDRKGIVGVTMPGFGTTDRTYNNAMTLMKGLGITIREISIRKSVTQHFENIGHDINVHDVTYENGQARERTQILMDLSNELGGMVIGTGDLSELALGWATYNGDHMSMYGVNASIQDPHTLSREPCGREQRRRAVENNPARHHRHAYLARADSSRRAWQYKAEDRRLGWSVRIARLLHLQLHALRFQSGKDIHACTPCVQQRPLFGRSDKALAEDLRKTILQPAVQALVSARRSEGGQRELESARRLAYAHRRIKRTLAGRM